MPKSNGDGGITFNPRVDKRVAQFIAVRDRIAEIEEEHKRQLEPYREIKHKLVGELLEFLEQTGQTSARTVHGTVSIKVTYTAPLSDPDVFMDFVRENDAYELMDRRANATACRGYAEENNGALPPGVRINSNRTVGVTKS